jgi:hypothetical protein
MGATTLFMIVEHFRGGDPRPVYERFRRRGRLAPDGLRYVSSWVTDDLTRCYQVMECDDPGLLDEWIAAWADLVDFDVHPVITSAEAAARALPVSNVTEDGAAEPERGRS